MITVCADVDHQTNTKQKTMKKKEKYRGSCRSVAAMAVMAHMMGLRSVINYVTWEGSNGLLFEIEIIGSPLHDWSADPNDKESELQNRKAILTLIALHAAEDYGHETHNIGKSSENVLAEAVLEHHSAALQSAIAYCMWSNNKECEGEDLYHYLFGVMKDEIIGKKISREIDDLSERILIEGEIGAATVLENIGHKIPFGKFEQYVPQIYPTWSLCFPLAY